LMMYCRRQLLSHFDGFLLKIVENIEYKHLYKIHDPTKGSPSWYKNKCVFY